MPLLVAALWAALAVDVLWDAAWALLRRLRPGRPAMAGPAEPAGWSARFIAGAIVGGLLAGLVLAAVPGRFAASMRRRNGSAACGSTPPWRTSTRTPRSCRGGRSRRRSGTGAGSRAAGPTSSSSTIATSSTTATGPRARRSIAICPSGRSTSSASTRDLPPFVERYVLERVEGVPSPGDLYRVVERRTGA